MNEHKVVEILKLANSDPPLLLRDSFGDKSRPLSTSCPSKTSRSRSTEDAD